MSAVSQSPGLESLAGRYLQNSKSGFTHVGAMAQRQTLWPQRRVYGHRRGQGCADSVRRDLLERGDPVSHSLKIASFIAHHPFQKPDEPG